MLPRARHADFKALWDNNRSMVGGYLNKKAGTAGGTSLFSKGKWQKRWFTINTEIIKNQNYKLEYFHGPDDKIARQEYQLSGAKLVMSGGNSFQLTLEDGTVVHLGADAGDSETLDKWYETLQTFISIADDREHAIAERGGGTGSDEEGGDAGGGIGDGSVTIQSGDNRSLGSTNIPPPPGHQNSKSRNAGYVGSVDQYQSSPLSTRINPFQVKQKACPMIRLDIDVNSIPPSSTQRHQFEEMFISDIARALRIGVDMVEIISVKPSPNMDWLVNVEFDIYVFPHPHDNQTHGTDEDDEELEYALEQERIEAQRKLLFTLHEMIADTSSPLYNGFITCKVDPGFSKHLIEDEALDEEEVYSAEPSVLEVMNRYKDIHVTKDTNDLSHFTILLAFENQIQPLEVPNPLLLRRKFCAIWPFEVKQALGLTGTMAELWIEPIALIPRGMPKALSHPLNFEPSARMGGAIAINASRLKADLTYDVHCEDYRSEVLRTLTEAEMGEIKATFDKYDINHDGGVKKEELMELIKQRSAARKAMIEDKYQEFVHEPGVSEEDVVRAQESRRQHMQQVNESQTKLLNMFDAADVNHDGTLSFTEFMLAEAWWIRCTLNPQHAHLF